VDLHAFIKEYTDTVYHARDPQAADRFIADSCIRHEHGYQVVMTLAENKARIAGFLDSVSELRFEFVAAAAENDVYTAAYQFSCLENGREVTRSAIEIFRVRDGKIVETWNTSAEEGPWG
jgi:predicted SnoaL-like aldol condensation-catalyzing enzyme